MNSTLNFGIPPVLVFQLEVCYRVDRLLTGITAQQKGTTARWYSNKTSLSLFISIYWTYITRYAVTTSLKCKYIQIEQTDFLPTLSFTTDLSSWECECMHLSFKKTKIFQHKLMMIKFRTNERVKIYWEKYTLLNIKSYR